MIAIVVSGIAVSLAGPQPPSNRTQGANPVTTSRVLSEKDAVQVLEGIRKALESNRPSRLIGMFDAQHMPEFPVFREQIEQFFAEYESFRVRYQVRQISQDGPLGSVVCEFLVEATSVTGGMPELRKRAQLRLVLAWDGHAWKIADLSPRSLFR